jgi:multiple sugar transport system substrate-binding protein
MSKEARLRRGVIGIVAAAAVVVLTAACSGGGNSSDSGKVTLEFSQWWAQELPKGKLQSIVDGFEKKNPNITVKLISQPFATLQDQTTSAAASNTLADVVGLDGAWVNPLHKQNAIANLSTLMKSAKYDDSELSSQVQLEGSTYMIPVVNFVYPLFTNDELLQKAGVDSPPSTRSEFLAAATAISEKTQAKGWILPLGTTNPNGVQNDVMSWVWASGGSMLTKAGKPDLTDKDVKSAVDYVKSLYDANAIAAGPFTLQETDKSTQFTNGQVGMMIDSLAHITTIEKANPNLKFSISAIPAEDGFSGKRGIPYASWGIGVSNKTQHKAEAWKFVQYLLSSKVNSEMSTAANGFPVNKKASPTFSGTGADLYKKAFEIYQAGYPANEFVGLPEADTLMRDFDTEYQKALSGDESTSAMLKNVQTQWKSVFSG